MKTGFRDFGVSAFGRRSWCKVQGVELRVYSVGRKEKEKLVDGLVTGSAG